MMNKTLKIPTRKEAIAKAKAKGLKIAAVLPIHYPRPLLRAYGFFPVEVWGPPGIEPQEGNAHFQSYTCSIVRRGASFLMRHAHQEVDLIVIPHACDALQGMGSVFRDFIKIDAKVLTFYPPRGRGTADLKYLHRELLKFSEELEKLSGVSPSRLELLAQIDAEELADHKTHELWKMRSQIALSDRDFVQLLRSREYLDPRHFLELCDELPLGSAPQPGVGLWISGLVPEPMQLFDILNELGAHILGDDLAAMDRRVYPGPTQLPEGVNEDDPHLKVAARMQAGPPDWTRSDLATERAERMIRKAQELGAKGVLIYSLKFCEPELFDIPILRRELVAAGLPILHIEGDMEDELDGQLQTRLEAFVETLQ
ncbi:2-hydroxyacyl-CoA dehydratase [Myxococcota bacterium]|nr:2-hydroxyacyl-CoA dehydratase [Myxococcota bacterium]